MAAILVSAKVSVFYSRIKKTFPKSSQRFYLEQTLIKHKKQPKKRLDKLFITKQEQKARNKNKIGLPLSGKLILEHLWGRRTGLLSVRRGAEIARRADRGEAHEQFTQLRSSPER